MSPPDRFIFPDVRLRTFDSGFGRHRGSLQSKLLGHRLFDHRTLEEVGVVAGVEARRVGECKLPEILFAHEAPGQELVRFGQHFSEIGHVEVSEVGAEDRSQSDAHPGIECPHGSPVVRLAAKIEVVGKDSKDILFAGDAGRLEIIRYVLGLPELFTVVLDDVEFPLIWSVIGAHERITRYQLVQREVDRFELRLMTTKPSDFEAIGASIVESLRPKLANSRIDCTYCDTLAASAGGKFRPVVSLHSLDSVP